MRFFKRVKRKYGKSSLVILLLITFLISNAFPGGLAVTTYAESEPDDGEQYEEEIETVPEKDSETENADSEGEGKSDDTQEENGVDDEDKPNETPDEGSEDEEESDEDKDDDTSKEQPQEYTVTFEDPGSGGELSAAVEGEEIASGEKVQEGSSLEFNVTLEQDFAVEKWTVNGNASGGTDETYTYSEVDQDIAIEVFLVGAEEKSLPNFKVSDVEVEPEAVKQGEQITVSATITNSGEADGAQDVELTVSSNDNDDQYSETIEDFSLPAGGAENIQFEDFPVPGDAVPGEYTVKVASEDEEETVSLVIESAARDRNQVGDGTSDDKEKYTGTEEQKEESKQEPEKELEQKPEQDSEEQDPEQEESESEEYTVTFEDPGSGGELSAAVDGEEIASGEEVQEGSSLKFNVTLEQGYAVEKWTVNGNVSGGTDETYTYSEVDQDIAVEVFLVDAKEESLPNFKVSDVEVEPEAVKQDEQITVSAAITNSGEAEGAQDVELTVSSNDNDDQYSETIEDFSLPAGGAENIQFEDFPVPGDAVPGEYTVKVATDDEEETASLVIESAARDRDQVGEGVTGFIVRNTSTEADSVTLSGDETVKADAEAAEGRYQTALDEEVEALVRFNLDNFDEADIDSLSEGDISDLLNGGIDITTDGDGKAELDIIFAADVDKSGNLKAAIDAVYDNVGSSDEDELNITVDTTEFEASVFGLDSSGTEEVSASDQVYSTYEFDYSVPEEVAASEEVYADVTFKTDEEGDYGYDGVRFKIEADGPGDVSFKATDTDGVEHQFKNVGYYPSEGFDLDADYDETTEWTLSFSEAGNYNVTTSLVKADTGDVVADNTDSFEVLVLNTEGSYFEVTITEVEPDRLSKGETVDVTAEIENKGSDSDEQDIKLTITHADDPDEIYEDTSVSLSVGAGDTKEVKFEDIERPTGEYTVKVESDDNSATSTFSVFKENEIFDNITTTFKFGERVNGELEPLPDTLPHPDDETLDLGVEHTFTLLEGHGYGDGAFYEFQLPEIFDYSALDGIGGDLGDFGEWIIDGETGTVRLEFNDNIEGKEVEGGLQFGLGFDEDNLGDSLEQEIEFRIIEETYSYTISFKPREGTSPVDKAGTAEPQTYEAEYISWTVDFNKDLKTIDNAVLEDQIHDDLALDQGSIELYDLTVNLDGSVEKGSISSTSFTDKSADNEVKIEFDEEINSAYRLKYDTTISDDEGTEYDNQATLLDGTEEIASASATVTVGRGEPLEKIATDYDDETQTITWEIRVNYNEKDLTEDESKVEDIFGDNQELVENSLEVYKVELDADGKEDGSTLINENGYTLDLKNDGQEGFEITFTGGIDQAHKITYETTATDRVEEDGTITNDASFGDESTGASQPIGQVILAKSHSNINYDEKTVVWEIEINRDSSPMKNVYLEDEFANEGLTFKEETFSIDSDEIGENDYTLTENEHGFEIVFNEDITKPLTITYTTEFDYEQRKDQDNNDFENEVNVEWEDENDDPQQKTASDSFTPNPFTQDDGFKEGEYDATTKEITWTVGINYNRQYIDDATFYDYVSAPDDYDYDLNHPGEINVYEATINPDGGMEKGSDVSGTFDIDDTLVDDNGNPGFSIDFGDIGPDDNYIIEYKTDLTDKLIAEEYHNNAVLKQEGDDLVKLDYTVDIPGGGEYAGKDGEQSGRYIDWELDINKGQSTLNNVEIKDTFDDGLVFLPESLELYRAEVNADGDIVGKTIQEKNSDYELDINGEEYSFKLSFTESIDNRYVLRYRTYINAPPNQELENKVVLTALEEIPAGGSEDSLAIPVVYQDGVGWAKALEDYNPEEDDPPVGNLIITKVSDDEENTPLQGAEFGLYDSAGDSLIKSGVTDNEGKLEFEDLIYGTYQVKELEAPEGYEIKEVPLTVEIAENDPEEGKSITIENELILGTIELKKVDGDDDDKPLEGARFELEDDEGDIVVEGQVTDASGKITFEGLPPGDYRIIETEAPDGYQMPADNQIDVTIEPGNPDDGGDLKEIEVKNYLEGSRSLLIEKIDRNDSSKKLSGAKFELKDSAGNVVATVETDEDGQAEVDDLSLGEYTLTEITAPSGYRAKSEPLDLEITLENTPELVKTLEVKNTRMPVSGVGDGRFPGTTQPGVGDERLSGITQPGVGDGKLPGTTQPGVGSQVGKRPKTPRLETEEEKPDHPLALPRTHGSPLYNFMVVGAFCLLLGFAIKKKYTDDSIRHKLE